MSKTPPEKFSTTEAGAHPLCACAPLVTQEKNQRLTGEVTKLRNEQGVAEIQKRELLTERNKLSKLSAVVAWQNQQLALAGLTCVGGWGMLAECWPKPTFPARLTQCAWPFMP